MASEYSVNIKLNTSQVKKDLKTIGDGIGNLGKKQAKGSKAALSDTEKQLKLENQSLRLQNQGLGLTLKSLPLAKKGVDLGKIELGIDEGIAQAKKLEFDLSRKSLLLADKEIKKEQILLKANENITKTVAKRVKLQKLGPTSPLPGLGRGAPLGLSGVEAFPEKRPGAMQTVAFPPKLRGPTSPIGGSLTLPGSPAFLRNQARSGLRGFDFQSALISGGFPLLFGQGPVGALAGGLGGGIGGMFGQMGGFAGGIAATAALQQITTITQEIGKLGNALARPTENIGSLVEKLGLANDPAGRLALRLEKLGLTSSASALLIRKFTEQTGKSPDVLSKATQEINEMNKELATLTLKFQLFAAEALTPIISLLNKIPYDQLVKLAQFRLNMSGAGAGGFLSGQASRLGNTDFGRRVFRQKGMSNIPSAEGNAVIGGVALNPNFGKTSDDLGLQAVANQIQSNKDILPLQQALELEKQRFTLNSQQLSVKREANKLDLKSKELELMKKEAAILNNGALDRKIDKLTAEVDLQRQIYENALILADPIQAQTIQLDQQMAVLVDRGSQIVALSQTIASSFEESFKGIINGTMSIQDAFRNMLNSIANHFINTAAKMMANQMQRSLLGFLGNSLFGGFFGGGGVMGGAGGGYFDSVTGLGVAGPNFGLANGGTARAGKTHLVGERGPELFTPGVTGTVTPNHALGGSTTVVVNVDASGSSVEGDAAESEQLGRAISDAIQLELVKQQRPGGLLYR